MQCSNNSDCQFDAGGAQPVLGVLGLLIGLSWPALAHGTSVAHRPPGELIAGASIREGAIEIDGRLDDGAWQKTTVSNAFWQREPHDGAPAEFATEFRALFDDEALYVAIMAHDPEPDRIRGLLTRRDEESASDWLWVSVDTGRSRRRAFGFAINPAGVQRDFVLFDDTQQDFSWDGVWAGAATVNDAGWSAELRIPFSQLPLADGATTWGLQVARRVHRTAEESFWAPWPKKSAGRVSLYGDLHGLPAVSSPRALALVPYTVAGSTFAKAAPDPVHPTVGLGLDATYRLSDSIQLTVTANPDFGQVEADPSEVNLTTTETFFTEKRPFFVDGADFFRLSLSQGDGTDAVETLFYSRRVGAPPHQEPDSGSDSSAPQNTTIYGAGRVTGRIDQWTLGGLSAVTAEESVGVQNEPGASSSQVLEPLTNYSAVSLRRSIRATGTDLALLGTGVYRDLAHTGLAPLLPQQAYAGGLEVNQRLGDDQWLLQGRLYGSTVRGTAAAIAETQQLPQHNFQRPDATHLALDTERTHLDGVAAQYLAAKIGGSNLRGGLGGETRTPGFEVNDLGYQRSADYAVQWLWAQYRQDEPGPLLRDWSVNLNGWGVVDYSGTPLNVGGNINGGGRLLNYWEGWFQLSRNHDLWDTGLLRGGPAVRGVPNWRVWGELLSDQRRAVQATLTGWYRQSDQGGSWSSSVEPGLTVQAQSNLSLSLSPFWRRHRDDQQFVDAPEDEAGVPHYVLGCVDQTTYGLVLRVSYTLTTNLSVQLYAQPFVSVGRYDRYREVVAPRARRYGDRFAFFSGESRPSDAQQIAVDQNGDGRADFSFEPADFTVRQLQSNLVVRWEYLPGSTMFLVWSHQRAGENVATNAAPAPNLRAMAHHPGEHVVMVKLSYRLEV